MRDRGEGAAVAGLRQALDFRRRAGDARLERRDDPRRLLEPELIDMLGEHRLVDRRVRGELRAASGAMAGAAGASTGRRADRRRAAGDATRRNAACKRSSLNGLPTNSLTPAATQASMSLAST